MKSLSERILELENSSFNESEIRQVFSQLAKIVTMLGVVENQILASGQTAFTEEIKTDLRFAASNNIKIELRDLEALISKLESGE